MYNAVGLAAYELFDSVDFDQWFKTQLLAELQVIHNRYVRFLAGCLRKFSVNNAVLGKLFSCILSIKNIVCTTIYWQI